MAGAKGRARSWLAGFRSRKHRVPIVALFAWLFVAQALLIVHRIDHASAGHDVACALCAAADHSGGPIVEPIRAIAPPTPAPAVSHIVERAAPFILVLSYRSRAPPQHLRS